MENLPVFVQKKYRIPRTETITLYGVVAVKVVANTPPPLPLMEFNVSLIEKEVLTPNNGLIRWDQPLPEFPAVYIQDSFLVVEDKDLLEKLDSNKDVFKHSHFHPFVFNK